MCCCLWEGVPIGALEGVGAIGGGGVEGEVDGAKEGDGGVADGVGAKEGVGGFEVGEGAWDGGEEVGDGDLVGNEAGAAGLECESEVKRGWVWFSNFYFYSLISLIEIYLL